MNAPIRILVVDDHALVRDTLCERLREVSDFFIVGTAEAADDVVHLMVECAPGIILMDIDMPGRDCFDVTREILSLRSDTGIIFLSAFTHDRYIEQALAVKARGYLTKNEPIGAIVAAIREVAAGGVHYSTAVRSRIVIGSQGARMAETSMCRVSSLTPRELEILRYITRALSKKEIAAATHLSVKTVDSHSENLMNKLDIHDRVELARFAIREGLADA